MTPAARAPGAIRVVTRCRSVDEFISRFAAFVDQVSIFIATPAPMPAGARRDFLFQLTDGTPALEGSAQVIASHRGDDGDVVGMRLAFIALSEPSWAVHRALLEAQAKPARRRPTTTTPVPPLPSVRAYRAERAVQWPRGSLPRMSSLDHAASTIPHLSGPHGFSAVSLLKPAASLDIAPKSQPTPADDISDDPTLRDGVAALPLAHDVCPEDYTEANPLESTDPSSDWDDSLRDAPAAAAPELPIPVRSSKAPLPPPWSTWVRPHEPAQPPRQVVVEEVTTDELAVSELTRITSQHAVRSRSYLGPAAALLLVAIVSTGALQLRLGGSTRAAVSPTAVTRTAAPPDIAREEQPTPAPAPAAKPIAPAASLLAQPTVRLRLRTVPSGAQLTVDGDDIGTSPAVVTVRADSDLQVTAKLPGHHPSTRQVHVGGRRATVRILLEPIRRGR